MKSSVWPLITEMKLSVDISAAMCMPGYSHPFNKALMKVVFPVEYWPMVNRIGLELISASLMGGSPSTLNNVSLSSGSKFLSYAWNNWKKPLGWNISWFENYKYLDQLVLQAGRVPPAETVAHPELSCLLSDYLY